MITKCTKLFTLLAICCSVVTMNAQTYWGTNPGEGDFDGGFNGWTVNAVQEDSTWLWHPSGTIEGGSLAGQNMTIGSATASNGAATFNADFYTFEGGPIGDPPYPQYISELISPTIDLSSLDPTTALAIEFNQLILFFQAADGYSYSSFAVSTDDGMTWSENYDCNEGLLASTSASPQDPTNNVRTLPIPLNLGLAGSSTVKIKFTFAGNFYYWALDDIKLVKRAGNDIGISTAFYAIAPSANIPFSQVENMGWLADVYNAGGNVATNVELQIDIETGGSSVHADAIAYPDMVPDSLYENVSWGGFTPDAMGTYNGTYTLVSDSTDLDPSDNAISFSFAVTDSVYAKETGATRSVRPADGNWEPAEPKNWAYGNHYYITNGEGYEMTSAGIVVTNGNQATGIQLAIYLYEWEDANEDDNCDPDERSKVGYNFYTITNANTQNNVVSVPMLDFFTNEAGVSLEDNTHYVLMVEYVDSGDGNLYFLGASEDYDYAAAIFNSQQIGAPRYAAMLGISPNLTTESFSWIGFGRDIVPVIRMHVNPIQVVNTHEVLSSDNILEASPSPATNFVNVNIDLVNQQSDALLRVLDAGGKVIESKVYSELQKEQLQLNVENWANGSYFLHLTTAEGIKAFHFVVQH